MIWLSYPTPVQTKQLLDISIEAFLPLKRHTAEELADYFHRKIVPRLEKGQPISAVLAEDKIVGYAIFEKWEEKSYYLADYSLYRLAAGRLPTRSLG